MKKPWKSSEWFFPGIDNVNRKSGTRSNSTDVLATLDLCKTLLSPACSPWVLDKPIVDPTFSSKSYHKQGMNASRTYTCSRWRVCINSTHIWIEVICNWEHHSDWTFLSESSNQLHLIVRYHSLIANWSTYLYTIHRIIEDAAFNRVRWRIRILCRNSTWFCIVLENITCCQGFLLDIINAIESLLCTESLCFKGEVSLIVLLDWGDRCMDLAKTLKPLISNRALDTLITIVPPLIQHWLIWWEFFRFCWTLKISVRSTFQYLAHFIIWNPSKMVYAHFEELCFLFIVNFDFL